VGGGSGCVVVVVVVGRGCRCGGRYNVRLGSLSDKSSEKVLGGRRFQSLVSRFLRASTRLLVLVVVVVVLVVVVVVLVVVVLVVVFLGASTLDIGKNKVLLVNVDANRVGIGDNRFARDVKLVDNLGKRSRRVALGILVFSRIQESMHAIMNIAEVGLARSILGSLGETSVAIIRQSRILGALSVKSVIVLQADATVRANDPGKR